MAFFPFARSSLICLFLCSIVVHSVTTSVNKNKSADKRKNEIFRNIFQHLRLPYENERQVKQSMMTVAKIDKKSKCCSVCEASLSRSATGEIPLRENFLHKGKPTILYEEFQKAVDRASLLEDNVLFQDLNVYHRDLARPLYQILVRVQLSELADLLGCAKLFLNKYLFHHVLRIVLLHRTDIDKPVPSHITLQPYKYFEMGDLGFQKSRRNNTNNTRLLLAGKFLHDLDSNDVDHRLEYFRLDPGKNTHHKHWHEVNLDSDGYRTENWTVDRSGEIFYYMHSQMISRYNFERFCVGVDPVEPLDELRSILPEPYFEKLTTETRAKLWDSRAPNHKLTDVDTIDTTVKIQELNRQRDRLYEAIDRGYVYKKLSNNVEVLELLNGPNASNASDVPFDVGIDKLADMVWAYSSRSVNRRYYGNLHNSGHNLIGNNHDPKGLYYKQSRGSAMSFDDASPRDPVFYKWHKFVDDIFERYKSTLEEYTIEELEFLPVNITNVAVMNAKNEITNLFITKFVNDTVNITEGISEDFRNNILTANEIFYNFTHLTHEKFSYQINVSSSINANGTVRIFLAPIYEDWKFVEGLSVMNDNDRENAKSRNPEKLPSFNQHRRMFIELAKFVYPQALEETHHGHNNSKEILALSGCGWPNYLLIPKGTDKGFPAQLFVMISDFEKDKATSDAEFTSSAGSLSYCGALNKLNPDKKPMGYPFDRDFRDSDAYIHNFMAKRNLDPRVSAEEALQNRMRNMFLVNVTIKHEPIS